MHTGRFFLVLCIALNGPPPNSQSLFFKLLQAFRKFFVVCLDLALTFKWTIAGYAGIINKGFNQADAMFVRCEG